MRTLRESLVMLICSAGLSAAVEAQEWPTYRHDNERTGVQPIASNLSNPNMVGSLKVVRSFPSAPAALDGPFVNTFAGHDQQHFAWLAAGGAIWDAFFSASDNKWHLQQINCGKDSTCQTKNSSATTDGPQAVADSFVDTFAGHDQQHFAYRDSGGIIWDSFFSASDNKWHCQQINGPIQNNTHCPQISLGGNNGPSAIQGPLINTFAGHDQQHFAWLAAGGAIWDAFFSASDNKWHLQQINCGKDSTCQTKNSSATTDGPQAVADSFVDTFAGHDQQHFAYRDSGGIIWDSFFSASDNKWHCQQINGPIQNNTHCPQISLGGNNGPSAIQGPFVNTFAGHDQQHFAWLAAGGAIWDAFFSASDNKWHLQQINCGKDSTCQTKNSSATTDGPQAVADSFVDTFAGHDQQHFAYRDSGGIIWDSFFSASDNKWHCQQINGPNQNNTHCPQVSLGGNNGPSAIQEPFINTFAGHDQQHFAWLAAGGAIWDAFFSASDNKWHLQQINLDGVSVPSVGPFQASPIVVNDTVYIGSEDGYFYALDASTLALKWQFPPAGQSGLKGSGNFAYGIGAAASFWADVRPHGAVVFAAQDPSLGEGGRLFALDAVTGKPITNWPSTPISSLNNSDCDKSHLRQRIEHSSPLVFNGKAYVGIQSFEDPVQIGQVAAIDLATGKRDQTFNFSAVVPPPNGVLGGGVWNAPATDGTGVYFTTGNVRQDNCGNNPNPAQNFGLSMIRADKDTGAVKWQLQPVPFQLDNDPDWAAGAAVMNASCGELIASVQKDGWSYAADPSGNCLWQFPPIPSNVAEPTACTWTGYSKFNPNVGSPWDSKHGGNGYRQPGAAWNVPGKDLFVVVTAGEALVHDDLSVGYHQLHALNACATTEKNRVSWIGFVPPGDISNDPNKDSSFVLSAPTVTGGIAFISTDGGHLIAFGDPSVMKGCGDVCSDVDFPATNCPTGSVVPIPMMLADVPMPDGGDIAYFHKEPVLAKGKVFVATDRGHVYMLEALGEARPSCH